MTEAQNPRICDILGVEAGEPFAIGSTRTRRGETVLFRIQPDGGFTASPPIDDADGVLLAAVNGSLPVVRIRLDLSDDEAALLRVMKRAGAEWFSRDAGATAMYIDFWRERPQATIRSGGEITLVANCFIGCVSICCLPSVLPAAAYNIDEVLKRGGGR